MTQKEMIKSGYEVKIARLSYELKAVFLAINGAFSIRNSDSLPENNEEVDSSKFNFIEKCDTLNMLLSQYRELFKNEETK